MPAFPVFASFSPVLLGLLAALLVMALVPWYYALRFFRPLAEAARRAGWVLEPPAELPPLSIVVCAHNDVEGLYRLVPELLRQTYPGDLEIVLVDDRSTDDTPLYLQQLTQLFTPHVRIVTIRSTPAGLNPKKYALTLGLKVSKHPHRLVTDADCLPASEHWAARMAAGFTAPDAGPAPAKVVLGFSGYEGQPSVLNGLVQYETLLTGALYLGAARVGKPYMGVGRNLAYTLDALGATRWFSSHQRLLGGDDDLFVQDAARARLPIGLVLHPESQTTSRPATGWQHFWRQKRRHMGAGRRYRWGDRLRAGTLPISGPLFYALLIVAAVLFPAAWPWLLGVWLARAGGLMLGLLPVGRNLNRPLTFWALPALDPLYSALYFVLGFSVLIKNPTRWK